MYRLEVNTLGKNTRNNLLTLVGNGILYPGTIILAFCGYSDDDENSYHKDFL